MEPLTIILFTFPLALAIIILGLYYISRKYPEKRYKTDPLLKSVAIVGIFLVIFIVAVGIGVIDKEWLQGHLWLFAVALIMLIAAYTWIAYKIKRHIPFEKRYKIALDDANTYYQARPYVGMGYFPTIGYHNVFEGGLPSKLSKELVVEPLTATVDVFLLTLKSHVIFRLLIVLNTLTGDNIKMVYEPSYALQEELLGKQAVSLYKEFKAEFEGKEEEEEKLEE